MITKEELLHYFDYLQCFGVLVWRNHWSKQHISRLKGKVAGAINGGGYRELMLKEKNLKVHRLIWFLENGTWPDEIDHIDGNRSNNQISNLRAATKRQNQQNQQCHRDGKLLGATKTKQANRWFSRIKVGDKVKYLGCFKTETEAHNAYMTELSKLHSL